MKDLTELKKRLNDISEEIARLKADAAKPKGRWKPEVGVLWWEYDACGVYAHEWHDHDNYSLKQYGIGNVYRTKEEAEQARADRIEYVAVMDALREIQGDFVPDWGDGEPDKYCLCYDHKKKKFVVTYTWSHQGNNWPVFRTKEDAQRAIDTLGDRLNILLKPGV